MNRITLLPENVKRKIAAGEVVEGPFSVVKELVENALDACADKIEIEVEESGLKKILIRDNGTGMFKEDVPLALEEHATSKIKDIHDIDGILSFGFRGEALSSIASISQFTILSRTKEEKIGAKVFYSEKEKNVSEYAGATGTTITVENLFYSVPARKKFLKSHRAEFRSIKEIVNKIALANPHVQFSLKSDGKTVINTAATDDLYTRIGDIYGKDTAENLIYEELKDIKCTCSGFLSKPGFLKSNRSLQLVYINNRPVELKYLGFILSRAYEAIAPKGSHPVAFIFITIDPHLVDVNIHPAKREVKLFDLKYVEKLLYGLAQKVLNRTHDMAPLIAGSQLHGMEKSIGDVHTPDSSRQIDDYTLPVNKKIPLSSDTVEIEEQAGLFKQNEFQTPSIVLDPQTQYENDTFEGSNLFQIFGTIFKTYILAGTLDSMLIVDFHAAHERMLYDSLLKRDDLMDSQELAVPELIKLTPDEHSIVLEIVKYLSEHGIVIEDFSDDSVVVRSIPVHLEPGCVEKVIRTLIANVQEERPEETKFHEEVCAQIACHSAKRKGDYLTREEMTEIVSWVLSHKIDLRCPHGRPLVYSLSRKDFERMFKR